jgi:hypothetical protein
MAITQWWFPEALPTMDVPRPVASIIHVRAGTASAAYPFEDQLSTRRLLQRRRIEVRPKLFDLAVDSASLWGGIWQMPSGPCQRNCRPRG